jgi:hypothetical protein
MPRPPAVSTSFFFFGFAFLLCAGVGVAGSASDLWPSAPLVVDVASSVAAPAALVVVDGARLVELARLVALGLRLYLGVLVPLLGVWRLRPRLSRIAPERPPEITSSSHSRKPQSGPSCSSSTARRLDE